MPDVRSQGLVPVVNRAFVRGEKFTFRAYYDSFLTGKVTAGVATLEVKNDVKTVEGRNCYHVVGEGKSKGAFNMFYKVNDRFETFIDEEYMVPWRFIRHTHEGSYAKEDEVRFNQYTRNASSRKANKKVPARVQDIISIFYYTRTLDFSNLKPGEQFPVSFFLDDSVYVSRICYVGREDIETSLGRFRCLRFKPMVATGKVFSQPYPMDIWVSDDTNRIPVLAKSGVIVGSVKLELTNFQGLAHKPDARLGTVISTSVNK
ncbi:MAG: DUF3108 domain-containing protein [Bacteroidota bacterium]|nr:DUF3108 domain-containing protein [Bacteroidota bacterium]